ncbi:MAG: type II toxin-antitoxin system prevent-host-death family antitoxin [Myxococcota bacterium]|nr:type II toxin-antitoxin system prevent-host-death family antitoxin [Myxococcota bacterium]
MIIETGVAEIKRRFSELLNRVALNKEHVVIQRRGKRIAAIVPIDHALIDQPERHSRRGLVAAVGAWDDDAYVDDFLNQLAHLRDQASDRDVEPLP